VNAVTFRPCRVEDIPQLLQMEQAAQPTPWIEQVFLDLYHSRSTAITVAESSDKETIGFAVLQAVRDEASLLNIVIAPSRQGQGIGQQLLEYLIDGLRRAGQVQQLFLEVRVSNFAAISLYLACGFSEVGERRGYYANANGSREDALVMALPILPDTLPV